MDIEYSRPADIEKRSMELISREMKTVPPKYHAPVIRRVIHTTADFEYEQTLVFSGNAVTSALTALRAARSSAESDILSSVTIVTDTNMALSGINKGALSRLNCRAVCYMADPAVAEDAERRGVTRAAVSMEKAAELKDRLVKAGLRVKLDDSDNSMGWKCAQYEMKGVPVRVEIGPRDIEAGQCVLVRRNDGEKTVVALENLEAAVAEQLELVQKGMFEKAKQNLDNHIYEAHSLEEAKQLQAEHGGFIKTMWCGELECELKMKEEGGMSSRCMPLKQEHLGDTCPICGKPAKKMIYWGIAY